jgi:hypothetical protein
MKNADNILVWKTWGQLQWVKTNRVLVCGLGAVVVSDEDGNEPSRFIKGGNFLETE